jgi:hypothetical protein|tara:strand:- start:56 stop:304 length:249 start_codon:yes stop_codon:yes gene_type:complete
MDREFSPLEERVIQALVFPTSLLVTHEVVAMVKRHDALSTPDVEQWERIAPSGDPLIEERKAITLRLQLVAQINEMTLGISA